MNLQPFPVAVTGSVAYDHIMNFPGCFKDHILAEKLHVLNVSFLVQGLERLRGGCAANIAHACALHQLQPQLIAAVGRDFGEYREWLEARGIDLAGVQTHQDLLTASCFITTDADNNQITGFYPGAMARAKQAKLSGKPSMVIVSPNDPDAMRSYPDQCRSQGIPFLYDPGQQVTALSGDDLSQGIQGAKVLVTNDYELAVVQEKTGHKTVDGLLELCEAVIVTLGEKGSRVYPREGQPVEIPPAPVKQAVDPTGAGDAYRGGLVRGLVSGLDWETSGRLAALTASYCVEVQGTSNYSFTQSEFAARFESAFGLVLAKA